MDTPEDYDGIVVLIAGDIDGNGRDEIILGTAKGTAPALRVLTRDGVLISFVQPYIGIDAAILGAVVGD
jgi:hypothetical protein